MESFGIDEGGDGEEPDTAAKDSLILLISTDPLANVVEDDRMWDEGELAANIADIPVGLSVPRLTVPFAYPFDAFVPSELAAAFALTSAA